MSVDRRIENNMRISLENEDKRLREYINNCEPQYIISDATDARRRAYKEGKITLDELKGYNHARRLKAYDTRLKKYFAADLPKELEIELTTSPSQSWGYTAKCSVTVITEKGAKHKYIGKATGAGYDKLSGAVASALCESDEMRKLEFVFNTVASSFGHSAGLDKVISYLGKLGFKLRQEVVDDKSYKKARYFYSFTLGNL